MTPHDDALWRGDFKIPWHEPDFSRRMLAEHLSQAHDLASRRVAWIDRQVAWLHERLLDGRPARILDLGCGPGFYAHRLVRLGHRCHGIDFGPASIEYARAHGPAGTADGSVGAMRGAAGAACRFDLGDIRTASLGGPHDLAMILYGEMNVFPPHETAAILRRVWASLAPGGRVAVEVQTAASVEAMGRGADSQATFDAGLFGDEPYHCRIENHWHAGPKVAVQTFHVTMLGQPGPTADSTPDASTATRVYRSTTQAWSDDALVALLRDAGFADVRRIATCCGTAADEPAADDAAEDIADAWPCNTDALTLWIAKRPKANHADGEE